MKEFRTLFFLAFPTALAIAAQVNAIRAMFGISGGVVQGLFYSSILLLIPISYLLYKIIRGYLGNRVRHASYDDFMLKYFIQAKDVVIISSGADQLSHFLEGLAIDKNRARPEVQVFVRNRDESAIFNDRKSRLISAMDRHGIKHSLHSMEWHPMMLSAVVANNADGIFNFYLTAADGYMSRAQPYYLHATRGRCDFDDWLFALFDRWTQDCQSNYRRITNET